MPGHPWYQWEPELVVREPDAMAAWRERLAEGIRYHEFVQYAFEVQWQELRAACQQHGLMLIGDLPIFVAHDSADVWANPELFYLDKAGQPLVVAGVPPDYFSETGQLLGQPALSLGCPRRRRLCMVGGPAPVFAGPGRYRPDRSFSRV